MEKVGQKKFVGEDKIFLSHTGAATTCGEVTRDRRRNEKIFLAGDLDVLVGLVQLCSAWLTVYFVAVLARSPSPPHGFHGMR